MGNCCSSIWHERCGPCHPMADGSLEGGYYVTLRRQCVEVRPCLQTEVRVRKIEDVLLRRTRCAIEKEGRRGGVWWEDEDVGGGYEREAWGLVVVIKSWALSLVTFEIFFKIKFPAVRLVRYVGTLLNSVTYFSFQKFHPRLTFQLFRSHLPRSRIAQSTGRMEHRA